MAIAWVGLSNDEIQKRTACVKDAWAAAQGTLIRDAIIQYTSQSLIGLLAGAVAMVIGACLVILIGNIGGAAIGGVLGSLAGGAGAVPGAAAGRLIGNQAAMALLNVLGVGLLLHYIASEVGAIGSCFYRALDCAWNSHSFGGALYKTRIEYSARYFAEGVGRFFGALVMALVIVLTRGKAEEKARVLQSKLMKICDGLEVYITRNLTTLQKRYQGGLPRATVTRGLPETPEAFMAEQGKARAAARAPRPFRDMPNFYKRSVGELRSWLKANRFKKVAEVRRPGQNKGNGELATDFQSEIWMRQRQPGGPIECVRVDPHGHVPPKFRDGPVRMGTDAKGKVTSERIAWGERPHYHLETIPADQAVPYRTQYVPSAIAYEGRGKNVTQMTADHQRMQEQSFKIFGEGGKLAPVNKWALIHVPLAP